MVQVAVARSRKQGPDGTEVQDRCWGSLGEAPKVESVLTFSAWKTTPKIHRWLWYMWEMVPAVFVYFTLHVCINIIKRIWAVWWGNWVHVYILSDPVMCFFCPNQKKCFQNVGCTCLYSTRKFLRNFVWFFQGAQMNSPITRILWVFHGFPDIVYRLTIIWRRHVTWSPFDFVFVYTQRKGCGSSMMAVWEPRVEAV